MRVRLAYTVEEEDVFLNAAKIVGFCAPDLQQAIGLFTAVQSELIGESDEQKIVNVDRSLEMLKEFREALLNIDTRLSEVVEIVEGYSSYQRQKNSQVVPAPADDSDEVPSDLDDSAEVVDYFGAD